MIRSASLLVGFVMSAASAAATDYSATLSAPASGRFIARDIVWNCGAAACRGVTEESRPIVLCQSLAKHAGPVQTFLVNGRAISTAELARCNAGAKASVHPLASK